MTDSEKLELASAAAKQRDYSSALQTLNQINPENLSEEEQGRFRAGREYVQKQLPLPDHITDIVRRLRQASQDPNLWEARPVTGRQAAYLPWQTVTRLLDEHAPQWQFRVINIVTTDTNVAVTVELEIAGVRRQASSVQERFGATRDGGQFAYPAPLESAERRAMARAATLFGCGANPPQNPPRNQRSNNRR